jgi:hypothetical protein
LLLGFLDPSQRGVEPFVGHDGSRLHARVLVEEGAAGQKLPRVTDLDLSVLVLVDAARLAAEGERRWPRLEENQDALVAQGQVLRELALLLPREEENEILVLSDGSVGVAQAGIGLPDLPPPVR